MGTASRTADVTAIDAANAIEGLAHLVKDDLAETEALIHLHLNSQVGVIPQMATHLVDAGGKRIRPLITLAAAAALGGGGQPARLLAAAVEFIHSATLLHDDVVDDSSMRRGKASANRVWGNAASVLVGDFLFARSFHLMVEAGDLTTLGVLAQASSVIAEGEVMQLAAANDADVSRERYMRIVNAKTATLFAAAAKVGAMAAGRRGQEAEHFEIYGRELGLAFQLIDDALDYGGFSAQLGKNVGDDFREGKVTLPVIFAREASNEEDLAFWRRTMSGTQEEGDFSHAQAMLRQCGAIARTVDVARARAAEAKAALAGLPDNALTGQLRALCDFVVERAY